MANISIKNLARAIYESSQNKDEAKTVEVAAEVVSLLDKKHLMGKSKAILDELERIIDKEGNTVRAQISTGSTMTDKVKKEVEELLKKRYKADHLILTHKDDPNLLGGIKIEVGDEVIDTTIRNKMIKLQNYLITN